ncbi:Reticulon protein [Fasciola hepatica]|uniref:Reticulon-like protein n=1 Tax=Fasciola hepatica TaxID=6192 RepID=A0A4E0R427_FASHE|nr:Reticulon protein [Fasciola hepatica]
MDFRFVCPLTVRDLVYWREPIKSGIFMVLGLTLLISLSCLSLVSIVAYAGLALLCCTAGYRMYCFLLNSSKFGNKMDGSATIVSDPFCSWINAEIQLPKEKIADHVAASSAQLNIRLKYLQDMLLLKNYFDTFQFGIVLYLLSVVGDYFNLLTLITIAFTLGMTLPKVYIMYQPHFDSVFVKVKRHTNNVYAKFQPTLKKLRGAGQRT